jgi:undecaprenyl-diphosphatase
MPPPAHTVADRTVLAPAHRRVAARIAAAGSLVVVALAVAVHGARTGTAFDDRLYAGIVGHLSARTLDDLLHLSDPVPMLLALGALAGAAAVRRHWRLSAVTVIAPLLALLLAEVVLKPLVDRTHEGQLAFPSGHETAPACLATILAVLVLRTGWRVPAKAAALTALVGYLTLCAIALVGAFLHYVTDTIGSVCLSVACVLATALVVDRQFTRRSRPAQ